MELEDKRALVTGGGRGIGLAIALELAGAGARVALLGRDQGRLRLAQGQIEALGRPSLAVVADLANQAEVRRGVAGVLAAWDGLDILVNNAGVQEPIGPTVAVDAEEWMWSLQVNLGGCFLCSHLVLPAMIGQQYGKIVNLSGGGAVGPRANFSAYSAAKAGVVRFTETLAAEVAPDRIDVNAIAPGAINTAMLAAVEAAGDRAGAAAQAEARDQRRSGGADLARAAGLARFLASPRSDGLSGRLLSAVWDRWEDLDVAAVMATEQFTVRRLK